MVFYVWFECFFVGLVVFVGVFGYFYFVYRVCYFCLVGDVGQVDVLCFLFDDDWFVFCWLVDFQCCW